MERQHRRWAKLHLWLHSLLFLFFAGVAVGQSQWNIQLTGTDQRILNFNLGSTSVMSYAFDASGNPSALAQGLVSLPMCDGKNILGNGGAELGAMTNWEASSGTSPFVVCDTTATRCPRNIGPRTRIYAFGGTTSGTAGRTHSMRQSVDISDYPTNSMMEFSGWTYQYAGDTVTAQLQYYDVNGTAIGSAQSTSVVQTRVPVLAWFNFEDDDLGVWSDDKAGHGPTDFATTTSANVNGLMRTSVSVGTTFTPPNLGRAVLLGTRNSQFGLRANLQNLLEASDNTWTILLAFRPTTSGVRSTLFHFYRGGNNNAGLFYIDTDNILKWQHFRATTAQTVQTVFNPSSSLNDWHYVAVVYTGTALLFYVTQSAAFSSTPTLNYATPTGAFTQQPTALLIGTDARNGNNGLRHHLIDWVTFYKTNLDVAGLNAWKTAIESASPLDFLNWGYTRFTVSASIPEEAATAEVLVQATDSNSNSRIDVAVDDLLLRCVPNK